MKKLRIGKKVSAFLLATAMSVSAFCAFSASAAETIATVNATPTNEEINFTASRSDDVITVNFVAAKDALDVRGVMFTQSFDTGIEYQYTTNDNISSIYPVKTYNPSTHEMAFTGMSNPLPNKGDVVASFSYKINDGFKTETDYEIVYYFNEAYGNQGNNDNYEGYTDLEEQTVTVTYREDPVAIYHNVTFINNGAQYGDIVSIEDGKTVSAPETNPTKANAVFQHWSITENGSAYNFDTPVTGDLTLYAVYESTATTGNKNVDLSKVEISKTLNKDDSVSLTETFEFELEFVELTPATSNNNVTNQNDIPNNITATVTNTGSVNLTNADFPIGGIYEYKVTEVKGSNSDMIYDDSEYHLFLEIEEDENGNLVLDDVIVKDKDGKKTSLSFTNNYAPTDTLTVSKTVKGEGNNPYNGNKKFSFAITFNAASVTNGQQVKVTVNGTEQTLAYGAKFEFTLGNGDSLEFTNIPEGTTYTLTESGEEYYTGSVVATAGSTEVDSEDGDYATDLTIGNIVIKDGGNKADVTNTYSITPPTGLLFNSDMLVILAVAVLALAGTVVVNRKLKKARQ